MSKYLININNMLIIKGFVYNFYKKIVLYMGLKSVIIKENNGKEILFKKNIPWNSLYFFT